MKKREFIKKAGLISASLFAISAGAIEKMGHSGSGNFLINNSFDNNPVTVKTTWDQNNQDVPRNLVIGSDHAGFPLKGPLIRLLKSWNYDVKDIGSFTPDPVDFPDIAMLLADEILSGRADRGIMVCGTGVGAAIACNKIQGIRAALCHDTYSAHQCVEHDNVNVLCIGAQIIGPSVAEEILKNFLDARFSTEEEFRRRVRKLDQFDLVPPKH
jgi:ribose 5-phosphate isomerase B